MPNIEQPYDAGPLKLQPDETGIEATAQAARRINAAYTEIGQAKEKTQEQLARGLSSTVRDAGTAALDYMQHREISHGAAAFANKMQQETDNWNDIINGNPDKGIPKADPNDPMVAKRYLSQLEPSLEEFKRGFLTEGGQQWAEQRLDAFRNHMFQKTSADMSVLARDAVQANLEQTTNQLSNTARSDPSSIDFLIDTAKHSVNEIVASSPNLKGPEKAHATAELTQRAIDKIVKSGALGLIENAADPDAAARAYAAKYSKYISGADLQTLVAAARQQIRMRRLEENTARIQQDHDTRIQFNGEVNKLEAQTFPKDDGSQPTLPPGYWKQLRDLKLTHGAALEPGRIDTAIKHGYDIMERLDKPDPPEGVSMRNTQSLLFKLHDAGDPKAAEAEVWDAYRNHRIATKDFNMLRKEVEDRKTPEGAALAQDRGEFFKRYTRSIDGAMDLQGPSALGSMKLYQAEQYAKQQEALLRKQNKDPRSLYDPASPNYLGNSISKYHVSLQDSQNYQRIQDKALPKDWLFSPSTGQYKDGKGNIYDRDGVLVRKAP